MTFMSFMYTAWVLWPSVCQVTLSFNIDPVAWKYISKPAAGFGYKVVQMNSTSLLVSAPLEQYEHNRRGKVYQCLVEDTSCKPLPIQEASFGVNMSMGLSMTQDPKTSKTLICGPTIPRECKTMTTYNGMCLEMYTNCNVFIGSSVHSSLKECPGQMDIAFLLDGSGSIITADFNQMKAFVKNLIREFLKGDVQFAIAQYSNNCKIHFDFNDFPFGSWENKINGIGQISGGTFTARAIKKVVKNVFSINGGSRPMAKKVLIVITDGNSHDSIGLDKAAYEAESKMIIRFAIGVGAVFSSKHGRGELETIASSPPSKHMFQVGSFQALDQIKDTLKSSIFSLEGSQTGDSIKMEMAQEGFSAAYKPAGGFHVASVGAFQWRGAYQEYTSATETPTLKQSPNMEPDSYMGYSMAVARTRTRQFTILGAPRYKHTGRVEVFCPGVNYKPVDFSGQIGAYFGAEICAVDIDNDSYMDFVLISAPTFTDRQREGRVYVCTISDWSGVVCGFAAEMTLQGDVGKIGRFGTSLAQLPDLNVDGFNDLAVGAPLENNGKGSVYIFHGSRIGISNIYSQKISGFDVQSGLKFFGLSISQSSLDMSSDSLPDLAVGSKGAVLLLRSKPIATIRTLVSFHPPKISTDASRSNIALKHTATVCFTMTKNTADNTKGEAKINYTLTLDVTRQAPNYRAYYNNQDKMRKKTKTVTLSQGQQCFDHIFFIMVGMKLHTGRVVYANREEPEDVLNELSNELDYTFEGLPSSGGLSLSLSPQTLTTTYHPLGFVTRCGTDNNCVDNLKVDFNFTGSSEMKVGIDDVLNVTVSVESREENSYNSRVILTYPAGLSFRRLITIQGKVECNSIDSEHGVTWGKSDCTINKPIFKSNSKVFFVISYGIDSKSHFEQIVTFTANASSGNNEHAPASELYKVKRIGVKYRIYVLITRHKDSTKYINFTAGKNVMQKHVNQSFVVVNYVRDFNLTVKIKVPMKLGDKYIWADPDVLKIPGCRREHDEKPIATDFVDKLKKKAAVDCSVAMCWVFVCSVVMRKDAHNTYNIAGNVSSGWIEQIGLESAHLSLISSATLEYDRNQYIYFSLDSHQNIPPVQTIETEVEVYPEIDFTKEIIGGAVGGLFLLALITPGLYKAGLFKSQFKQIMQDAPGDEPGGDVQETVPAE
ncbi:integrin alpha-M [Esox lucius]|uniref:integrin alpha-M n=1 Tax=Esox lucius TaxID=8010 RepID=UPI0014775AA4|nr:integrin alpha-M [Esox lucius]